MTQEEEKFKKLLTDRLLGRGAADLDIVLEGQYTRAYELLDDSVAAGLTPIIVGPVGVGKSILIRKFAHDTGREVYEVFFDELMRPAYLIGSFNPAIVLNKGYCLEAFEPGPLLRAMVEGGVFIAQELNRATEYCQNTLLEPLEERAYYISKIGRVFAHEEFVFVATANPAELAGTHRFSEALRDRLRVWIPLSYPTRSVELEIIKLNLGGIFLDPAILERIYNIVHASRIREDVEQPASLRAGISIARLCANYLQKNGELTTAVLQEYSKNVLFGSITVKSLENKERVIDEIVTMGAGK